LNEVARQFRWEPSALESTSPDDVENKLRIMAASNCRLIVTTGPLIETVANAARENPSQPFLITDFILDPPLSNVWVQTYDVDQAAFLAGYAAASVSQTGKVGTFGGVDIPQVTDFMDGFALGVAYYNRQHARSVTLIGWNVEAHSGLFVGGFCCSEEGRVMAEELLAEGVDILMPVAGESVGWGAGVAVQEHGGAWLIGVDVDWRQAVPDLANVVWTSVEKRYDASVVHVTQSIVTDGFSGGIHPGSLETGEVGLSPFNPDGPFISPELSEELELIQVAIIAGDIQTRP
jgi:basic membrane protein A